MRSRPSRFRPAALDLDKPLGGEAGDASGNEPVDQHRGA
jgi:hypothetical protein